jgi:IclR family KDG regulon transcriptional repressor
VALSRPDIDVRAIAAPVFDHNGLCSSALSLVAPSHRFDFERLRGPLLETAQKITALLQGKTPE